MSAALAAGKPARSAPNTEYSIVVSSDTRKIATLATQNTGQGDAGRAGGSATAGAALRVVAGIIRGSNVVVTRCGSGELRQVARPRGRQALLDESRALVGQH